MRVEKPTKSLQAAAEEIARSGAPEFFSASQSGRERKVAAPQECPITTLGESAGREA